MHAACSRAVCLLALLVARCSLLFAAFAVALVAPVAATSCLCCRACQTVLHEPVRSALQAVVRSPCTLAVRFTRQGRHTLRLQRSDHRIHRLATWRNCTVCYLPSPLLLVLPHSFLPLAAFCRCLCCCPVLSAGCCLFSAASCPLSSAFAGAVCCLLPAARFPKNGPSTQVEPMASSIKTRSSG